MSKTEKMEMLRFFTEAFKSTVLPEIREFRAEFSEFKATTDNRFDFLFKQFEKLDAEYVAIKHALFRIERRLDAHDKSKADLEKEVKMLKGEMKLLQQRVAKIEKDLRAL